MGRAQQVSRVHTKNIIQCHDQPTIDLVKEQYTS